MIELRQPLKDFILTQEFGADFRWSNPAKGGLWEWFYKDTYKPLLGHPGCDLKANTGTPVYSANDGICLYAGYDDINGNMVQIWNEELGFKTLYGHNSVMKVKQGESVKAGQLISLSGSTGDGTGPHVHFGFKLTGQGGNGLHNDNGYNGASDPMPYITMNYLGNKLIKKDMIFKKEKNDINIYLINEEFGTKMMVSCMEAFDALKGKYEEVDNLDSYIPNGTFVWVPYIIN